MTTCRHLVFILGDQLDDQSSALADFDVAQDVVLMAEVRDEATHVWSTKPRTAFFFAAMRHFAAGLRDRGINVDYRRIGAHKFTGLIDVLSDAVHQYQPQKIVMVEPGDWRVEQALRNFASQSSANLVMREDIHFMCSRHEFAEWAHGYKQFRLEYFYRMMRKRYNVMMEGNQPLQGRWNFDSENRGAFPKTGPVDVPARFTVSPDAITQTLKHGYAHHIQRLMVTGIVGLLAETKPQELADWYLAVYVDAVEWVELPNVAGCQQWSRYLKAVCRERAVHQAHVELLQWLQIQAGSQNRQQCASVHHVVLGVSRQARKNADRQSADRVDGQKYCAAICG